MLNRFIIFTFTVLLLAACNKKVAYQSQSPSNGQNPSSLNPEQRADYGRRPTPKEETFFFGLLKKKKKLSWGDQLVVEYQERMEQNAKDAKKKARKMKKPQYSDPTYFGHKRKPKKRSPDKMKFCEECGIRH